MTPQEVKEILVQRAFPEETRGATLLETHGSWILLTDWYAYKIKKPVEFSFMDFSTLEKRRYYCHREVELNQRLTQDVYLGVDDIRKDGNRVYIGAPNQPGELIDYAVRMRRLDSSKQMHLLLAEDRVFESDMYRIANQLADFHRHATIIYAPFDQEKIREDYFDLEKLIPELRKHLGAEVDVLEQVFSGIDDFLKQHKDAFQSRVDRGFIRDGHGDLHAGNIFLLEEPVLFDCLEFNDQFRQLDVLDELAFLCMDLEFHQRNDLASLLLARYLQLFPCMETQEDQLLFEYYKSYRANIRLKVSVLQSLQHASSPPPLDEWRRYFPLISNILEDSHSSRQG